mgnify:CR=1 FL=1
MSTKFKTWVSAARLRTLPLSVAGIITGTALAHEGLQNKTFKHCKKCEQNKPISKFENPNRVTGYNLYCNVCKPVALPKKKKKPTVPDGKKKCPRCKDNFPLTEFVDKSTKSGKRSLCAPYS